MPLSAGCLVGSGRGFNVEPDSYAYIDLDGNKSIRLNILYNPVYSYWGDVGYRLTLILPAKILLG